jgi:cytoskeletal protein RodZ
MKQFEIKDRQFETLPEYLKDARASSSYELYNLSRVTNISHQFLDALEKGLYHKLPADVYVFGFLRKLADIYDADPEALIEQYKSEKKIYSEKNRAPVYKNYMPSKISITPKTITVSLLAFFVVFVLGYLIYQVQSINKPPFIKISSPEDGARITNSSLLIIGQTSPSANLTINEQQVFVDSEGNFKQPVSISPGEKILTFVSRNTFGKESTKQLVVYADFQTEEQLAKEQQREPVELTVNVDPNSTWVIIQIDGKPAITETFIAGSSRTYTAKNRILISTGDAGSTKVTFNGFDLGELGRNGEVLRDIPFTADSVQVVR